MKTRRLTTILTSAYLSAMLTSSVAPIRSNATLATAINPSAAQTALQTAVSGLDAAGWAAAVQAPTVRVSNTTPTPITVTATEPVMNVELMARLIEYTRGADIPTVMAKRVSKIFGLNDGTTSIPVKQATETLPEGMHFFIVSMQEGSKDIIIGLQHANSDRLDFYLTDKTGVLRAAATADATNIRLITNEQAAEKFKAEMRLFAKLAQDLPPATTAVAGNS